MQNTYIIIMIIFACKYWQILSWRAHGVEVVSDGEPSETLESLVKKLEEKEQLQVQLRMQKTDGLNV